MNIPILTVTQSLERAANHPKSTSLLTLRSSVKDDQSYCGLWSRRGEADIADESRVMGVTHHNRCGDLVRSGRLTRSILQSRRALLNAALALDGVLSISASVALDPTGRRGAIQRIRKQIKRPAPEWPAQQLQYGLSVPLATQDQP